MKKSYASKFAAKGGKARAAKLTKEQRSAIARSGGKARWAQSVEIPTCPLCSGEGALLGQLGNLIHFRCIQCGAEFNQEAQ